MTLSGRALALTMFVMVALSAPSQTLDDHLPQPLRGPWTDRHAVLGRHEATLRLPEGWSIQDGGIAVSGSESAACRIDFVPTPGRYDEALARELAADREKSGFALHSELCCGGDRRVVSVRYADAAGNTIERRYFELRSTDGGSLLTLMLTASPTPAGRQCQQRFAVVADSLRVTSPAPPD